MRLFKRRCSDPSPQLVSLSHIEEPTVIEPANTSIDTATTTTTVTSTPETNYPVHRGMSDTNLAATASRLFSRNESSKESTPNQQDWTTKFNGNCSFSELAGHDSRRISDSEPASRDTSAERSNKKGLTTWSKKVSRRWDALRRSDSSEIPTSPDSCSDHRSNLSTSSGGRRQQYSLSNLDGGSNDDISIQNQKRVSRVESIRNLFGRQKEKTDGQEFKKRFDDIVSKVGVNTVLRNKRKSLNPQTQSPSYELNEKQLLEYLLLCRPEGCNRSLDELIQNFKDTVRGSASNEKMAALSGGVNKRLGILREENQNRFFNNSHRHSAPVVASSPGTSNGTNFSQNPPLSVDDLCAVLNGILASTNNVSSNRILRPTDESGYDSDSTRTGSPRGSERGVDSPRSSPRGSIKGAKVGSARSSQMSSKRGSLEERAEEYDQIGEEQIYSEDVVDGSKEREKRLDWKAANELLEQMCSDNSLNDSNTSKSLLEGFNASIRTLTNTPGNNLDLDKTPEVYTGDTADEHSSSSSDEEEVDCDTLKRKPSSSDTSTVRRRSNSIDKRINTTKSLYLESNDSKNNFFLNSTNSLSSCTIRPNYDVIFDENLKSLPSFSKIEREFSSLKTLSKTSTGLDNDEVFSNNSNLEMESEEKVDKEEPVVRPGVVDEIVENFESRVRSSSVSNSGTIIRKGQLHVSTSNEKEFKCARLFVKNDEFCGLLVEKAETTNSSSSFSASSQRTGCILIVGIEKNSPANLNGSFRINDELVKVNGRRMRGLSLKDVREYLNQTGELEIVVSRLKNQKTSTKPSHISKTPSTSNLYQSKSTTTLFKQNKTFADNFSNTVTFANFSNAFQNRSKSYQDQNWTLAQKTVPKIGQLYTPLALSNSRAKSFDKVEYKNEESRCANEKSTLTWNYRKNEPTDFYPEAKKCEITIRSQKRVKEVRKEEEDKPEIYINDQPEIDNKTTSNCCCKSVEQNSQNSDNDDGKNLVVPNGRNPNAPKIVGGTLKPNVNPEDVQIKKEKVNIDRSFEIESPVKKFAASPAKHGISGSIGRRSSPAKLTGMKKFYYGHQKRRSLQAVLSPERPQAEPIMSSDLEENEQQSREEASLSRTLRTRCSKSLGSFQSIPEHCDTSIKNDNRSSETYLRPKSVAQCAFDKNEETNRKKSSTIYKSPTERRSSYSQEEPVPKVVSRPAELLKVQFVKGAGRPSLGFTIAGGADSPKGSMGIYVKTVLPGGQAEKQGCLRTGDEILSVNTIPLSGLTRTQATAVFAKVRTGTVTLRVLRRGTVPPTTEHASASSSNRCPNCTGEGNNSFGSLIKHIAENSKTNTNNLSDAHYFNTNLHSSCNTVGIPTGNTFIRPKPITDETCFQEYLDNYRTNTYVVNNSDNDTDTDTEMKEMPLIQTKSYISVFDDHNSAPITSGGGATYIKSGNTNIASGNTYLVSSDGSEGGGSGGRISDSDNSGHDFDMCQDVDAFQDGRVDMMKGSRKGSGYFKRAKRLYSAITTNI